jgi:hypothetical protein
MELTLSLAGTRRPFGGWKWIPLGASIRSRCGRSRQFAGGTPYARLKARVNASCDE